MWFGNSINQRRAQRRALLHATLVQIRPKKTQPALTALRGVPFSGAQFGEGTGPILIDNVQYIGNEARLLDCAPNAIEISVQNCYHSEDASVRCQSKQS